MLFTPRTKIALTSSGYTQIIVNFDGDEATYFDGGWSEVGGNVLNDQISLGSELLVDTGFDDAGSWLLGGAGASIAGSKAVLTASVNGTFQNDNSRSMNTWYRYSLDIDSISGGGVNFKFWLPVSLNYTSTGTKTGAGRVTGGGVSVIRRNTGTVTASMDNFSIKPFIFLTLLNALKSKFGLADGFFIDVYINAITAGNPVGILWNYDGSNNFGMAYMNGINLVVDKNVNGTYSNLANVAQAVTQDQILRIEKPLGSDIVTVKYNGVSKATPTISDASIVSNTGIALFSTEANNAISKIEIGAL